MCECVCAAEWGGVLLGLRCSPSPLCADASQAAPGAQACTGGWEHTREGGAGTTIAPPHSPPSKLWTRDRMKSHPTAPITQALGWSSFGGLYSFQKMTTSAFQGGGGGYTPTTLTTCPPPTPTPPPISTTMTTTPPALPPNRRCHLHNDRCTTTHTNTIPICTPSSSSVLFTSPPPVGSAFFWHHGVSRCLLSPLHVPIPRPCPPQPLPPGATTIFCPFGGALVRNVRCTVIISITALPQLLPPPPHPLQHH